MVGKVSKGIGRKEGIEICSDVVSNYYRFRQLITNQLKVAYLSFLIKNTNNN